MKTYTSITVLFVLLLSCDSTPTRVNNGPGQPAEMSPPDAPALLTAHAPSSTSIRLDWIDMSGDEAGFLVAEAVSDTTLWAVIDTIPRNGMNHTRHGLTPGVTRFYRVAAFNRYGSSSYSATATVTPILPAPSHLQVTALSATGIALRWTDNSQDETGFLLERQVDGGLWEPLVELPANRTTFTNTGLIPDMLYSYRLKAIVATGFSEYSGVVSSRPSLPHPTGLTAKVLSVSEVRLTWVDNSPDEDYFLIERSADGGEWESIGSAESNDTTWLDEDVVPGIEFSYRVRAGVAAGYTSPSNIVTVKNILAAPTELTCKVVSINSVRLQWQDNSIGESGFHIERQYSGKEWHLAGTTGAGQLQFYDTLLTGATTYNYRVKAVVPTGGSDYSNTAIAVMVPKSPILKGAKVISSTSLELEWVDDCEFETGHRIEQSTDGTNWQIVAYREANETRWIHRGLTPDVYYRYRITAHCGDISSLPSNIIFASARLLAPRNLTVEVLSSTSVMLRWLDNSPDETEFEIIRKSSLGPWFKLHPQPENSTSYKNQSLTPRTSYSYMVRAVNRQTVSGYTNQVDVIPKLPAPSQFKATAQSPKAITLTWIYTSNEETGFRIERQRAGGEWTALPIVEANLELFTDNGLIPQTKYSYRMVALNAVTESDYTEVSSATTPPLP